MRNQSKQQQVAEAPVPFRDNDAWSVMRCYANDNTPSLGFWMRRTATSTLIISLTLLGILELFR